MHRQDRQPSSRAFNVELWRDLFLLLGLLIAVYLPVMNGLPLRSTGDEKTYMMQAIEMARHQTWFKQTLFERPDYYKGPLFLILLRLGLWLFGAYSPLALTYMNALGYGAAAVGLAYLMAKRLPKNHGSVLLTPALVVLSCGGYAHALASQMEALLVAAYAVFLALLGSAALGDEGTRRRLAAWLVAGLAGWLKSPIHALLLGLSAVLYWLLSGDLQQVMRRPREWGAALFGVVICIAGYLPALFSDRAAFLSTYIYRETLNKGGGNGVTISEALTPFFTAHLLPWLPLLGAALWTALRRRAAYPWNEGERRLLASAVALAVPTLFFFTVHPYRNGIYILPVLPAFAVIIGLFWTRAARAMAWRPFLVAERVICALIAICTVALAVVLWRLSPWPVWWGPYTTFWILGTMAAATFACFTATRSSRPAVQAQLMVLGAACFFAGVGRVLVGLSDHDRYGVAQAHLPSDAPWLHTNLHAHLWSETGLLNILLQHEVRGVYTPEAMARMARPGLVFIVPDREQLAVLRTAVASQKTVALVVQPWRRWLIHGEGDHGEPAWLTAWRQGNLTSLERDEYLVTTVAAVPTATGNGVHPVLSKSAL